MGQASSKPLTADGRRLKASKPAPAMRHPPKYQEIQPALQPKDDDNWNRHNDAEAKCQREMIRQYVLACGAHQLREYQVGSRSPLSTKHVTSSSGSETGGGLGKGAMSSSEDEPSTSAASVRTTGSSSSSKRQKQKENSSPPRSLRRTVEGKVRTTARVVHALVKENGSSLADNNKKQSSYYVDHSYAQELRSACRSAAATHQQQRVKANNTNLLMVYEKLEKTVQSTMHMIATEWLCEDDSERRVKTLNYYTGSRDNNFKTEGNKALGENTPRAYLHDGIFYYIWGTGADAAWHSRMEDRGTRLVLHHFSPHVYTPIVTRATYCGVHATVIVCCPIEGDRTCVAKHDSDIVDPVAIDVVKCFRATFEGGGSSTASRDRPPRGAQLHCGTDARLYLIGNASWLCAVPELVDVSIQQQPQTQGAEGLLATTPVFPKRTYFFPTTHYFKEQLSNSNKNSRFPSWCNDDAMDGANRKSAFATDDDIISSSESRDSVAAVQRIIDVVIPEIALEVVEKLLDFDTILSMFHDRGVPSRFLGLLMTYLVRVTVPPVSIIRSIQIEVVSRALHDLIRMDWEEDWRRRRGKVFKPQQLPVVGTSSPLRRPSTAIIPSKNIRRSVTPGPSSLAMSTSSLTSSSPQEEPHVPACFARAQHLLKIVMAYPGAVPYDSAD
eukprot:PhM_4_TR1304/c2_g1_i3/m.96901